MAVAGPLDPEHQPELVLPCVIAPDHIEHSHCQRELLTLVLPGLGELREELLASVDLDLAIGELDLGSKDMREVDFVVSILRARVSDQGCQGRRACPTSLAAMVTVDCLV